MSAETIELLKDSLKFGYPAVSVVLGVTGTLTNATSLTYFIKKEEKSIGDKLLMLLNSIDLLLCITATTLTCLISIFLLKREDSYYMYNEHAMYYMYTILVLFGIYIFMMDGTAFVTCLLSVTRGIGIAFPFYQIKGKLLVIVGIVVFIMMELSTFIIPTMLSAIGNGDLQEILISRIVMGSLVILVVVSATVVAVYKLTREDLQGAAGRVDTNNRKATWTVVILSTLFFVFNFILLGAEVVIFDGKDARSTSEFVISFAFFGLLIAIPFNSAVNPIVYLVRKSDMRQFFSERLPKLSNIMQ